MKVRIYIDCTCKSRDLEIAHICYAVSRLAALRTSVMQSQDWLHNLEIGTQSQDFENAQPNLQIAQILR